MNTFPANYKKEREAEAHENYTKDLNAMLARSKYNYPQETVRFERNVSILIPFHDFR